MQLERREVDRSLLIFQPACLEIDGKMHAALMRDISSHGAGFEGPASLQIGQTIRYRWSDEDFRSGTVSWLKDGRFGVTNDRPVVTNLSRNGEAYRSVRIPVQVEGALFLNGIRQDAQICNFAQRGACVDFHGEIETGMAATIKFGRRYFEGAMARWIKGSKVGFTFQRPLPIGEMANMLDGL